MNGKGILFILMMITVTLSSLAGGKMKEDRVEAVSATENLEIPSSSATDFVQEKNIEQRFQEEQKSFREVFHFEALTEEIKERITGVSWDEHAPYSIDDLAYITVTFYGFDDKPQLGRLIMHKQLAPEILEIFKELYEKKFPIEKIKLIDEYDAVDEASMSDNNSSGLCVRVVTNRPDELSKHSFGVAIDINPIQNPYVYQDKVLPQSGEEFLDRSNVRKGMIVEGDDCYRAFIDRGWTWGGNWVSLKDYQHFEKDIEISITGNIPDISDRIALRHLKNAFEMANKIIRPCSEEILENNNKLYAKYPKELNSKEKILSNLRVFYTSEISEKIYEQADTIIVDNILYGYQENVSMWNVEILSIKLEQCENPHIRKYAVKIQGEEDKAIIEMKYIGSQGWRINHIQR